MKLEAVLLLGPTGAGKSPLGDWLEQHALWGRRCRHFDFGANLRAIVAEHGARVFTAKETRFLRRVLDTGALLEAEHFPLAARVLDAFVAGRPVQRGDLLVLNGLPRHRQQAAALARKVTITAVVQLDCDAHTVVSRLRRNSGGDRTRREDDSPAMVARKLAIYEERTRPLLDYYRERGTSILRVAVGVATQAADVGRRLQTWRPGP